MTTHLPKAEWTTRKDLAALVTALGADNVRWVGGAVRDTLLGAEVRDIDAATTLEPVEVIARCTAAGLKTVPTGIDHGTVTVVLPNGAVEVTTLRHDIATDGRRATVAFAQDWRDDAARRDFTINALYAHPQTLEISDWFGGREDLAAGRVRFIGDARQRIAEDHLRILRYYRFQARFGSALDPQAEAACTDLAPTLKGLSRERVSGELQTLLALPDPVATVQRMADQGVLGVVLPEATPATLALFTALVAAEARSATPPSPIRRMAALLPADRKLAEAVASRLRLSAAQKKRLATAAERSGAHSDPFALAYYLGIEAATDRLLLAGMDPAPLASWTVPELPLKGGEIVARGVGAGPEVARVLRAVEARWVAEGFPPRERVEQILVEELRD